MASIQEIVDGLRRVLNRTEAARRHVVRAADAWHEAAVGHAATLASSARPEVKQLAERDVAVRQQLGGGATQLGKAEAAIRELIDHYLGNRDTPPLTES
ncbi:MAG TPA: BTAD domain-containing putative transcriptional regulator [Pseudonocardiaceae bacterium]|nr:BTAD domain-containing putative transcriptional regulator [Pseudonocardiaceae bacterium]